MGFGRRKRGTDCSLEGKTHNLKKDVQKKKDTKTGEKISLLEKRTYWEGFFYSRLGSSPQ